MAGLFKNKKVTIMGLGLQGGGVGVAKFFCKQRAKVLVTDLKTRYELKESLTKLKNFEIRFVLGKHKKEDFINADLIIKNPAVPDNSLYLKIAKKHKIPVKNDIEIFFDICPGQIIGITGTKGKSTTATLIYLFLKEKFPSVFLAGNIGISPLEILPKIHPVKYRKAVISAKPKLFDRVKNNSKIVLELSSFELENLKKSPQIAVITTLFPDHLNRYKNFKEYIESKKPIFKYQNKNDVLFLNKDNIHTKRLAREAKSKIIFFSENQAAISVAKFFKIPEKNICKVLSSFKGIPHRQEFIAEKRSVKYINDTAATTPDSVILAIKRFKKKRNNLILIAGGVDKNLNYKKLTEEIKKNVRFLILLPGTATDKIKKGLKYHSAKSMREAVKKASDLAHKGDVVLLSPGAASFNLFQNEFDRGKQFIKFVKKIK